MTTQPTDVSKLVLAATKDEFIRIQIGPNKFIHLQLSHGNQHSKARIVFSAPRDIVITRVPSIDALDPSWKERK